MRFNFSLFLVFSLSMLQVSVVLSEDSSSETLAGHSYHGEAFNEGPRQQATLMTGLGRSQFKISCKDEQAQKFFNQGIDQLHGFWYFEAERSFRQVAMIDPDCAMAYWGLAMANNNNEDRATKFIDEAKQKSDEEGIETSEREIKYIVALHDYYFKNKSLSKQNKSKELVKQLEAIVMEFPEDIEAKAFLACQIWMNQRDIKIASHL